MKISRSLQQDIDDMLDMYLWFQFLKNYNLICDFDLKMYITDILLPEEKKDEIDKVIESTVVADFKIKPLMSVNYITVNISLEGVSK